MRRSPNAGTQAVHRGYRFANEGREAPDRFTCLSTLYDPGTVRQLEELGVTRGGIASKWGAAAEELRNGLPIVWRRQGVYCQRTLIPGF